MLSRFRAAFLLITPMLFLLLFSCGSKPAARIVIIGLDAANWEVIGDMVKNGELPNIKKLMDEGAYGRLGSLTPTSSALVWNTIATGKTPEEHGIQGMVYKSPRSYETSVPRSTQRKCKALWNIFSEKGLSVCFLGWWSTWPAEKVNGVMVSDRLEFSQLEDRVFPPEDSAELDHFLLPKEIEAVDRFVGKEMTPAALKKMNREDPDAAHSLNILATYFTKDESMKDAGLYLLKKGGYNVFSLYLQGLDPVEHYFWKYAFPEYFSNVSGDDIADYGDVIRAYYRYYDGIVGEYVRDAGKDTTFIILSDHGMKPVSPDETAGCPTKGMFVYENGSYIARYPDINKLLSVMGYLEYGSDGKPSWKNTRAYSWNPILYSLERMVCVNLKGREPEGIIDEREKDALIEEIKTRLEAIKTAKTGKPLFAAVERSDKDNADLVCLLNPEVRISEGFIVGGKVYGYEDVTTETANLSGIHCDAPDGIIIISGPGVKPGGRIDGATVYDVAPTVLYIAGLPVAKDMKGKVLKDVFAGGLLDGRQVSYVKTYESGKVGKTGPAATPADDEIKKRLKSLGYVQ